MYISKTKSILQIKVLHLEWQLIVTLSFRRMQTDTAGLRERMPIGPEGAIYALQRIVQRNRRALDEQFHPHLVGRVFQAENLPQAARHAGKRLFGRARQWLVRRWLSVVHATFGRENSAADQEDPV